MSLSALVHKVATVRDTPEPTLLAQSSVGQESSLEWQPGFSCPHMLHVFCECSLADVTVSASSALSMPWGLSSPHSGAIGQSAR